MGLEEKVRALLEDAQLKERKAVPDALQNITKERVRLILTLIDRCTDDMVDTVFALLDDQQSSWFPKADPSLKFCDGASIGHIGAHIGILQRGNTRKLDREGRDYWVKPLCEVGAVQRVILLSDTGYFISGHPIAKSPNSAYRLDKEFMELLKTPGDKLDEEVRAWIEEDSVRKRLKLQALMAVKASRQIDKKHATLISTCIDVYMKSFLPGFEVLYVDDQDGNRITKDAQAKLKKAGLELILGDAMPDVLLWKTGTAFFWVVEAVTSDGEVDLSKVTLIKRFLQRTLPDAKVGFTTAYRHWRDVARRQGKYKNLAPNTYLWVQEDPSKHFQIVTFDDQSHSHLTFC
ncbi:MAG: hypothetical protein K8S62_13350 [Candidatus Sabulitectum sp.]|nr:hypothetical protein [Candidatus Sabulitectum sp.]